MRATSSMFTSRQGPSRSKCSKSAMASPAAKPNRSTNIRSRWAPTRYNAEQVRCFSDTTIAYYDRFARAFWNGTRDHDVSQNYAAFLGAIEGEPPYHILDLGCGPGRDLSYFRSLG